MVDQPSAAKAEEQFPPEIEEMISAAGHEILMTHSGKGTRSVPLILRDLLRAALGKVGEREEELRRERDHYSARYATEATARMGAEQRAAEAERLRCELVAARVYKQHGGTAWRVLEALRFEPPSPEPTKEKA